MIYNAWTLIFFCRYGFKTLFTLASVLILASMATIAGLVGDKDLDPVGTLDR